MKILINLLSTEIVPSYLACKTVKPDRVICLTTLAFQAQPGLLQHATDVRHEAV